MKVPLFSIFNLESLGVEAFSAMITPPVAAILAMCVVREVAIV
jgi:pyruvate/2-oxoglutarate dehydrogenase complex dihydrolipoamide acyltransferase (E2) component